MFLAATSRQTGNPARWRDFLLLLAVLIFGLAAAAGDSFAKPRFSAIAVDARTGKVLFARDVDGPRYPASLTKVMTLYVLFQDLKAGRVKMSTPLRVSRRAAAMSPSKLGLKAGQTITVEQAIKALVTKSANDVAATIGENLGGTEAAFAIRMTKTARALGMSRTAFKNASGLPDPRQVTTARDMATLSLRIQRDFPQYYPYFRISAFTYKGRVIRSHNRLLGRYAGTDGIKTGYIRASGFNLTTSAKRGDKRVVGVVLGATSGGSRNSYMMSMLDQVWSQCKSGKGIVAGIGKKATAADVVEEPEAPVVVPKEKPAAAEAEVTQGQAFAAVDANDEQETAESERNITVVTESMPEATPEGWVIQIGAFPNEEAAQDKLAAAQKKASTVLGGKKAFTMAVEKDSRKIYRARFAGFSKTSAAAACRKLGSKGIACQPFAPQS